MHPKVAKFATKAALGAIGTAAIGIIVKAELNLKDRVDEHYDKSTKQKETEEKE